MLHKEEVSLGYYIMKHFVDDVGHLVLQEQLKSRKHQYIVHIIRWGRQ
jgi:EamA domain-containing membrane protein RarD